MAEFAPAGSTGFLIFALISLITSGMIAWVWNEVGRPRYMLLWAVGSAMVGGARLSFALIPYLPTAFGLAIGGVALSLAVALVWAGARLLRGGGSAGLDHRGACRRSAHDLALVGG